MSEKGKAQIVTFPGLEPEEAEGSVSRLALREAVRMAEALIFASAEPVTERALAERLPTNVDLSAVLRALQADYARRGVNLVRAGDAWAFRTAPDLAFLMNREAVQQKKLSRAALEVLAIIAYHQPVTRAELEDIRGVETSKGTLDVLMETGWVKMRGRRRVPGRPVTYGTTESFLDHFGLPDIRDLPGLEELRGAGLLSARMPPQFSIPVPSVDPDELTDGEEPLSDFDLEELGLLTPKVEE
jgi:segregation and condensation protein B